jgi:hypothetical protein
VVLLANMSPVALKPAPVVVMLTPTIVMRSPGSNVDRRLRVMWPPGNSAVTTVLAMTTCPVTTTDPATTMDLVTTMDLATKLLLPVVPPLGPPRAKPKAATTVMELKVDILLLALSPVLLLGSNRPLLPHSLLTEDMVLMVDMRPILLVWQLLVLHLLVWAHLLLRLVCLRCTPVLLAVLLRRHLRLVMRRPRPLRATCLPHLRPSEKGCHGVKKIADACGNWPLGFRGNIIDLSINLDSPQFFANI